MCGRSGGAWCGSGLCDNMPTLVCVRRKKLELSLYNDGVHFYSRDNVSEVHAQLSWQTQHSCCWDRRLQYVIFSPQHWRAGTATTCNVELCYVQFYVARTVFGGVAGSAQRFPSTVFNAASLTLHTPTIDTGNFTKLCTPHPAPLTL